MFGQTGDTAGKAAPTGLVVSCGNVIHTVANLDKTLAFYHDALGLEINGPPGVRKPTATDRIQKLANTPGAQFRNASVKIPGVEFGLEFTEFTSIEQHPGQTRFQDPGDVDLVLNVRDFDQAYAAAQKGGATPLAPGDKPATRNGPNGSKTSVIFMRDPDGFVLELMGPASAPSSAVPAANNVTGGLFGITMQDTDKAAEFYRGLGFEVKPGNFIREATASMLTSTENVQIQHNSVTLPGTSLRFFIYGFKDVDQKAFTKNLQDPGTSALSLRVRDLAAAMKYVKSAGLTIVTTGGEPVMQPNGGGNVFVRDPSGFLLELIERAPQQ
jgi:catechol 2,3-dioxygenase-like lactoylglutathione lyase family enzyme